MSEEREQRRVSRRTITKGAAWAVPAVPLVVATPAYAASGEGPTVLPGVAFKWPGASCVGTPGVPVFSDGEKSYLFTFRVENTSDKTIYLYDVTIETDTTITFDVAATTPPLLTALAPGSITDLRVWANSSDSGNLVFTATATVEWGHNPTPPDPDNHPPIVETWEVPGTPTTNSQGYGGCAIPPYVALPPAT